MKRLMTAVFACALAIGACSNGTADDVSSQIDKATDASVASQAEQNAVELATEVEAQMDTLSTEIQSSQSAEDLQNAWTDVQGAVTTAIASMQTDGTVTTDGLQEALDNFQTQVDQAGEEIGPEVKDAWQSLKTDIEQMMN